MQGNYNIQVNGVIRASYALEETVEITQGVDPSHLGCPGTKEASASLAPPVVRMPVRVAPLLNAGKK